MARTFLPAAAAVLSLGGLVAGAPASAQTTRPAAKAAGTFTIRGGGFGHGIGMSQYGAMGYALHGWNADAIIGHYYQDTSLGRVADATVTVLLETGSAAFSGASAADGHRLSPGRTYHVISAGGRIKLTSGGRSAGTFAAPLTVTGASLAVAGKGNYAGSLRFYPDGSGVDTVNAVGLEDYVRGVIAAEMPASWPLGALEAQAIAARTYVLADTPVSPEYDVYSDTRSQMYGGESAETAPTNAAETATAGEVVESGGRIIPTYFFASSGGHTESIQNVWLGVSAAPYLVGVSDPYDDSANNPYYRWSQTMSLASAGQRLAGLYQGSFRGIKVLEHGVSPRVVNALVVGTRGSSTVSGATLEADLGTDSTWMSFTSLTVKGTVTSGGGAGAGASGSAGSAGSAGSTGATPVPSSGATGAVSAPSGGVSAATKGGTRSSLTGGAGIMAIRLEKRLPRLSDRFPRFGAPVTRRVLSGSVFGAARGARVEIERQASDGRWSRVGDAAVSATGDYRLSVARAGIYRVVYAGVAVSPVRLG